MADEQQEIEQQEEQAQGGEQPEQHQSEKVDLASFEAVKRKNQELLGELKKVKAKNQENETERERIQRERMEAEGKHKELAETHKADAERYKRELAELKASIASKEVSGKALELAAEYASDARNAKLLARFFKEELDFVDDGVVAKNHASVDDLIKTMEQSGDYASLWRGKGSTGGGAPGGKHGGGAAGKKFQDMTGAELSTLRQQDPGEYQRLRDEFHRR